MNRREFIATVAAALTTAEEQTREWVYPDTLADWQCREEGVTLAEHFRRDYFKRNGFRGMSADQPVPPVE